MPGDDFARYERLFAGRGEPFAFVDMDALWANSRQMLERARSKPIRVASKSVRCVAIQRRILESNDRYRGQLTFTLPETLWLAEQGFEDLVVAYPTVDRAALATLAALTNEQPDTAPVVMVDCAEHLDLIEAVWPGGAPVSA